MKKKSSIFNISDDREQLLKFRSRTLLLQIGCFVLCLVLLGKLFVLQVVEHKKLQSLSDRNRFSFLPLEPTRGRILDRNGKILADNRVAYQLKISPLTSSKKIHQKISELSSKIGFDKQTAINNYRHNRKHFRRTQTIPFISLTEKQAAYFANISFLHPEFELALHVVRNYPYKHHAAHVIGYIGKTNERDKYDLRLFTHPEKAQGVRLVGKAGLERFYDQMLRGTGGHAVIETNARGHKVRQLESVAPQDGQDLYMSLDIELQQHVDTLLQPYKGAVVVMDVNNGEILAMASAPSFDNNWLIGGNRKQFATLSKDKRKPFLNRATHGLYPPASTFKPFIALAGLDSHYVKPNEKIFGGEFFQIPDEERRFHDWKKGGHGSVNLYQAIERSSDVYFYKLAYRMGMDRMYKFLSQFPFGELTGIDLPGESRGILPNREWKLNKVDRRWLAGETVIFGIGQGYLLTTPLQLNLAVAAIANHGQIVVPHFALGDQYANLQKPRRVDGYRSANWQIVIKAMEDVIYGVHGTARKIGEQAKYRFAGKTGTAQIFKLAQEKELRKQQLDEVLDKLQDHSLFVAFAPLPKPRIAVTVIIENGGSGSKVAAPIAREIMDRYFELNPWSR